MMTAPFYMFYADELQDSRIFFTSLFRIESTRLSRRSVNPPVQRLFKRVFSKS